MVWKSFLCLFAAAAIWLEGCSRSGPETTAEKEPAAPLRAAAIGMEAQRHFGIEVSPLRRERLSEYLQVVGTVQPLNSRVAEVRPLARGRLLDVLVRVGDRVRAGQPLAHFDNIEAGDLMAQFASANAELNRLKVQAAAQAAIAERRRQLLEKGAVARKEYEQSRAEQEALEHSVRAQQSTLAGFLTRLRRFGIEDPSEPSQAAGRIPAPFAGIVTKANVAPGETIGPETGLFTIADISLVWVQAEVYEKDLGRLKVGQPAIITVDTYPDQPFHGKVTYISDILDPQTRTAKVRCELANPGLRLKLNMFASVQLPTTFDRDALAVPADTIQQIDGRDFVFVQKTPAQFEAREVRAGGQVVNGAREILSGLSEGEPVVTRGAFHLKSILAGKGLGEE